MIVILRLNYVYQFKMIA